MEGVPAAEEIRRVPEGGQPVVPLLPGRGTELDRGNRASFLRSCARDLELEPPRLTAFPPAPPEKILAFRQQYDVVQLMWESCIHNAIFFLETSELSSYHITTIIYSFTSDPKSPHWRRPATCKGVRVTQCSASATTCPELRAIREAGVHRASQKEAVMDLSRQRLTLLQELFFDKACLYFSNDPEVAKLTARLGEAGKRIFTIDIFESI